MTTYRYTDETSTVVHVIDDDGISRMSMLAYALPPNTTILPFVPAAPIPPTSVSMRQGRLALLHSNMLHLVDAAIAGIDDPVQKAAAEIEWEYATSIDRNSQFVQSLATELNLTEQQLDDLFLLAATF